MKNAHKKSDSNKKKGDKWKNNTKIILKSNKY